MSIGGQGSKRTRFDKDHAVFCHVQVPVPKAEHNGTSQTESVKKKKKKTHDRTSVQCLVQVSLLCVSMFEAVIKQDITALYLMNE